MVDPWAEARPEEEAQAPPRESGGQECDPVLAVVCALVKTASASKALELASHLVHLNYEGPGFLEIHGFLKGRYETHLAQFDSLTEFVRSLDYLVPMDIQTGLCTLCHPMPATGSSGRELLAGYLVNLEDFGVMAKELFRAANCAEAIDVENYAAELVADTYKATWFIKALLR